jgi:putative protein-disulfide isomerase
VKEGVNQSPLFCNFTGMIQPVLIYCYDAWCNWCYAFRPVMAQLEKDLANRIHVEVLSGGMILPATPKPIQVVAEFLSNNMREVTAHTGVEFGNDFLWHVNKPDWSDWFPSSEKAAIALCVFKEYHPDKQVAFASDLVYALQYEGRDLNDDEAYRHLLEQYGIDAELFYAQLKHPMFKEKAYDEFAICRQLKVNNFPVLLLQLSESRFITLASGYATYETVRERLAEAFKEAGIEL